MVMEVGNCPWVGKRVEIEVELLIVLISSFMMLQLAIVMSAFNLESALSLRP